MLHPPHRTHASERAAQSSAQKLAAHALEHVANAIVITDDAGRIIWVNKAYCKLCGYESHELIGNSPAIVNSGMQSNSFYALLWQTILSGNAWRGIITDRKKDGTLYTVDETITPLLNDDGVIANFIAIAQDITLRGPDEEKDRYLAYHDALTGLPNRVYFHALLRQAVHLAAHAKEKLALMFLDLDKFKPVNDSLGHEIGDQLLQAVGNRLQAGVRKTDTVVRFGGDEFAIVVQGLQGDEIAETLASKLVESIGQPFGIGEHTPRIGLSIGIAMYPDDGESEAELIKRADQAMYAAKQAGGGAYRFYRANLHH